MLHIYMYRFVYGFHNLNYENDNHSDNDKKINNLFSNISLCQSVLGPGRVSVHKILL